jgi:hypothetical protein
VTHIYVSREELYEKVWNTPVYRLAPEFGLSDRGLAKLCARMEVPVPGLGYWRKVELGHKVKREPLLNPSQSCQLRATIWVEGLAYKASAKKAEVDPLITQVKEFESRPGNLIVVPEAISTLHPLVKNTLKSIRSARVDDYGRCRPSEKETLDVCCSKEAVPRVARILHTLITALKKRGHTIRVHQVYGERSYTWDTNQGTCIEYYGEKIRVSVMEKVDRVPHIQTAREKQYNYGPKYDYVPNGRLTLKVENVYYCHSKHTWFDTKSKPLEEQMNAILIDLAKVAVFLREEREKKEEEERERERRKQEAELLRQRQLEEKKRIEHLEGLFSKWQKANQIREFILMVERLPIHLGAPDMSKEEWLEWAKNYADQLDPLIEANITGK